MPLHRCGLHGLNKREARVLAWRVGRVQPKSHARREVRDLPWLRRVAEDNVGPLTHAKDEGSRRQIRCLARQKLDAVAPAGAREDPVRAPRLRIRVATAQALVVLFDLGFGRIFVSEIEAPNMLANLV